MKLSTQGHSDLPLLEEKIPLIKNFNPTYQNRGSARISTERVQNIFSAQIMRPLQKKVRNASF